MKTKIAKRFMVKEYDNSLMFNLPPTSKDNEFFFFQNKSFVKQEDDCFVIDNNENFNIKIYNREKVEKNLSARTLNEEYSYYNKLVGAEWENNKELKNKILISAEIEDMDYFVITDKINVKGNKLDSLSSKDIISQSYEEIDFYYNLQKEAEENKLNEQEEQAYLSYVSEQKERLNGETDEEWFNYVLSRDEWALNRKQYTAQYKINNYKNDKKYENNLPYAIRNRKQYIVWKWWYDEKRQKAIKFPMNPYYLGKMAKSDDSYTWATFDKCCEVVNKHEKDYNFAGVGIMFDKGIMGIDFDHCIQNGKINEEVKEFVDKLGCYTEYSPSGDGLHIILFGSVPEGYGNRNDSKGVECYDNGRFFTLTGNVIDNNHRTMRKKVETQEILQEFAEKFLKQKSSTEDSKVIIDENRKQGALQVDDEKIIQLIRKSVKKNVFEALFDKGEVPKTSEGLLNLQCMKKKDYIKEPPMVFTSNEEILKYYEKDNSSCDAKLCGILAGYTDSVEQLDRIFRQSALMREKWDSKRGNSTYGQNLCITALNTTTWKYTGKRLFTHRQGQMGIKINNIQSEDIEE